MSVSCVYARDDDARARTDGAAIVIVAVSSELQCDNSTITDFDVLQSRACLVTASRRIASLPSRRIRRSDYRRTENRESVTDLMSV